jgi:prepilin peptidase CpaA
MSSGFQTVQGVVAIAVALGASAIDIRWRRIPNILTFGAAAAGLVFHVAADGLHGAGFSAGGWATGLVLFLPWFVLGGMGAGDVKLVAALGAWLGAATTLWVALYSAIAGGVLALIVALSQGYLRRAFSNLWWLFGYWRTVGIAASPGLTLESGDAPRLAYALPIAVGTLVALWLQ